VLFLDWLMTFGRTYGRESLILAAGLGTVASRWYARQPPRAEAFFRTSLPWLLALFAVALAGAEGGPRVWERWATASLPKARTGAPNIEALKRGGR
jgi:hypothetical protein